MRPSDPSAMPSSTVAKRDALARALLAGPGAAVTTMLIVMGLSAALPPGPAGIDAITLPLVAMPFVWAALVFHACLDPSPRRAALVASALCGLGAVLVVLRHGAPVAAVVP